MDRRPVPGFPGLYVDEEGTVWSLRGGRFTPRAQHRAGAGHLRISVRTRPRPHPPTGTWVHRLVALAWHGPAKEDGLEVCHKNGDPRDNRPENLYWGTRTQNRRDAEAHRDLRESEKAREEGPFMLDDRGLVYTPSVLWGF